MARLPFGYLQNSYVNLKKTGGKTIVPFCTHEGSALDRSTTDIKKLCPQSTILDGLAIRGGNVNKIIQRKMYPSGYVNLT